MEAEAMTTLATAWMLGCVTGFFMGVTVASRRRPTCRELMRDPVRQPSFAELLMPPDHVRHISVGYQPRPQQGTPNPLPSEP
jgi:hypothetical protein